MGVSQMDVNYPITRQNNGLLLGVITCGIRFWGNMAEGVSYAILIMNLLVPYINALTRHRPLGVGGGKK